ncbi:MAG: type II toxin-antitoxin system prevent-host-death family antitoxin [Deltaproteobacteria bacterium]|nr:type II toxin-antitoxin system prevent-host-death family antitoxin [Deltaproteobacteria bacterium]MBZ0219886.1 type II toxin-antitoxin system prevent-host-death family antitoxin [Deltaproteobacteria bacterium]
MNTISTKELKTKLRGYLDKVSRGEKFIITDHMKEVALLMPVPNERRVIHSLIEAKKAKWNGGKPAGIRGIRTKVKLLAETILKERW